MEQATKASRFERVFVVLLVATITVVFLWMIRSFLMPLLLAAIFSSLARPLYLSILSWIGGRRKTASALTVLVLTLLVVLPFFGFVGIVANQASKVKDSVAPWIEKNLNDKTEWNRRFKKLPGATSLTPYRDRLIDSSSDAVRNMGNTITAGASALTRKTAVFFVKFAIMIYSMFFFFIDGPKMLAKILSYIPLQNRDEKKLLEGFHSMASATVKSMLIIGAIQGTLGGLAFWIAGIPSAILWGTVMALLSVVPNIGSALVWVPACLFLFVAGNTLPAVMLFLWCAVVVGSVDNLLKPILVERQTKVPELLVLVSTLGGVTLMGLPGFILGPSVALVFLMAWEIYGTVFKDALPPPAPRPHQQVSDSA
jgi:predicted PurR-regulated permease PerM